MWPKRMILPMFAVTLTLAGVSGGVHRASMPASAPGCNGPEFRQFDMFAGDWDGYDVSAPEKLVARIHVTPMAGGCALREVYEQNDGLLAESFSMYDAGRGVWHQSWVTNRGQLMMMEGHLEGDRMVLTATDKRPGKDATLLKSTWHKAGSGVSESAVRSKDGGKTWVPEFDMIFKPHTTS